MGVYEVGDPPPKKKTVLGFPYDKVTPNFGNPHIPSESPAGFRQVGSEFPGVVQTNAFEVDNSAGEPTHILCSLASRFNHSGCARRHRAHDKLFGSGRRQAGPPLPGRAWQPGATVWHGGTLLRVNVNYAWTSANQAHLECAAMMLAPPMPQLRWGPRSGEATPAAEMATPMIPTISQL